jgi:hypothetical protein
MRTNLREAMIGFPKELKILKLKEPSSISTDANIATKAS